MGLKGLTCQSLIVNHWRAVCSLSWDVSQGGVGNEGCSVVGPFVIATLTISLRGIIVLLEVAMVTLV